MATIKGTKNRDVLAGTAVADVIYGYEGNDVLDGKGGIDLLYGGTGDDIYTVDNILDRVIELSGGGIDLVRSSVSFVLGGFTENLTLLGAGSINGTGNTLANTIIGNSAANTLAGGDGNDRLTGGGGNDTLIGGTGIDVLNGGAGNDTYDVDHASDSVSEAGGSGIDLVRSTVSRTLGTGFENLTLLGAAAINGTGNSAANIIKGNNAANILIGLDGADTLEGGGGGDRLDGGLGVDRLVGGAGDDTYVLDTTLDVVVEAAGGGTDTIRTDRATFSLADANFANVENVVSTRLSGIITISGNALNNVISTAATGLMFLNGGAGNDTITMAGTGLARGEAGNDHLTGGTGQDGLSGGDDNDTLRGLGGDDVLVGGAGDDRLEGGNGADTLLGDAGTDTIEGGDGLDLLAYSYSASLLLNSDFDVGIGSGIEFFINSFDGSSLNGTAGSADSGIDSFSGIESIRGSDGSDTFSLELGFFRYDLDGAGGPGDRIDFGQMLLGQSDITLNLATGDFTVPGQTAAFLPRFTNFENVSISQIGAGDTVTITLNNAANTINLPLAQSGGSAHIIFALNADSTFADEIVLGSNLATRLDFSALSLRITIDLAAGSFSTTGTSDLTAHTHRRNRGSG